MKNQDYSISFTANVTPQHAFDCINNVTKWWTENLEGRSHNLNDEFTVSFFDDIHRSTQRLVEVVPGKKVVWLVTDSKLNFLKKDKEEWTNTRISFEIFPGNNLTEVRFTHFGLLPEVECYDDCSVAWGGYLKGSLLKLMTTGEGKPEKV